MEKTNLLLILLITSAILMLVPWINYFRVKFQNKSIEANKLWRKKAIWFDFGVLIFVGALVLLKIALGWIYQIH